MKTVEVRDEGGVYNPPSRNPHPLLRTIALPIYQVLETPASTSGFEQAMHGVDWAPLNKARRRRRCSIRNQRTFMDRLKFGDMECWVNLHRPGQSEPDSRWVDHLQNGKRANVTGRQLT